MKISVARVLGSDWAKASVPRRVFSLGVSSGGAFEMNAIPLAQSRPGFVGAFAEIENRLIGRRRSAGIAVLQEELAELSIPIGRRGAHRHRVQTERAGCAVGVKRSLLES